MRTTPARSAPISHPVSRLGPQASPLGRESRITPDPALSRRSVPDGSFFEDPSDCLTVANHAVTRNTEGAPTPGRPLTSPTSPIMKNDWGLALEPRELAASTCSSRFGSLADILTRPRQCPFFPPKQTFVSE